MKYLFKFVTLSLLLNFISCNSTDDINDPYASAKEFEAKNNLFLKESIEKVSGAWKIEKMIIEDYNSSGNLKTDTIFYNVGTIFIRPIDKTHPEETTLEININGNIKINNEIIPIRSGTLFPFYDKKIISGLIEVDPIYFPEPTTSSDQFSTEYTFIDDYFLRDVFEMKFNEDEKTWIWKGSHSTKELVLKRVE